MNAHEFLIDLPEYAAKFSCSMIRLPRSIFIWAGMGSNLGHLSVGVPSRDQSSCGSIILENSSRATQLSSRLSKLLKMQIFVSGDLSDEADHLWMGLEDRIKEEITVTPDFFAK